MEKQKVVVKYYKFVVSTSGTLFEFDVQSSCHAEVILRGMVHSGMSVSIQEVKEVKELTNEEIEKLALQEYSILPYVQHIPYFLRDTLRLNPLAGNCGIVPEPMVVRTANSVNEGVCTDGC